MTLKQLPFVDFLTLNGNETSRRRARQTTALFRPPNF
jgi:hypothetical protein